MTISVWADVGGTFTDCIVNDESRRYHTKVLSSGVIRARFEETVSENIIRVSELAGQDLQGFWDPATIAILDPDGYFYCLWNSYCYGVDLGNVAIITINFQLV